MSRYGDRVDTLVAFLQTQLGSSYYVTGDLAEATGTGIDSVMVMVYWQGMTNDTERGLTEPAADAQRFIIVGIPVAGTNADADTACDTLAEEICDAIRSSTAQRVFALCAGAYMGWRVAEVRKGPSQRGQMAVEVQVEVLVEEDSPAAAAYVEVEIGHDFGTVYLTATETRTLIIHNPGTGTLAVTSITVPDWITAGALPATVAAGASEEVVLTLDTSEAGSYTGDVVLATSAGTITTPVEVTVSAVDVDDSKLKAGLDMGNLCTVWRLVSPTRTNPVMTGATSPSGTASASSQIGGGYEAWRAMDGLIATGAGDWVAAAGVFPSWLQYQFSTATLIKSYRITTRNEANYPLSPKSWIFAGSNNGTDWTTLDTQTNVTAWANARNTSREYYLPTNTTAYAYYRLTVSAGNQNYAAVGELELCAALPVVAQPTGTLHLANDTGDTTSIDSIVVPDWLSAGSYPASIATGGTADVTLTCTETTPGDYTGDIVIRSGVHAITVPVSATVYAPA